MDPELPFAPQKRFLTMGEMSRLIQVPAHTLRYWESRLGFLRPARRPSGHRLYTREDAQAFGLLRDLVYKRRLTLAGARKAMLEQRRTGQAKVQDGLPESVSSAAPAANAALKILRDIRQEIRSLADDLK